MTRTGWIKALLCTLFLGVSLATAVAQDANTGSISGTVTDSTGAAIKGVEVALVNDDRHATVRTVKTNGEGFYTATALPLGNYTVKISGQGFAGANVTGVVLHVGDALTVSQALKTGGANETVTVVADAARVNLEDATVAGLINSDQIDNLVMVTRNYESLLTLMPGVSYGGATDRLERGPVGVGGASSTVSFAVNGGRNTSNNWTIDGADNLDRGANLTLYVYISPSAISEFKVLRGQYSASYGRNAAGQVDVVTKSGTNSLHGSAYEYFRNDYLDANSYLNNQLGTKISKYRYNDFGFTLGGPAYIPHIYNGRGKTFWFISENWLREVAYSSTTAANLPTTEERAGDFSNAWYYNPTTKAYQQGPVNVCTAFTNNPATQTNTCTAVGTKVTNVSTTAQNYLKDLYGNIPAITDAMQQANVAKGLDPHTYLATLPNKYDDLDTVVRIDHQFGQKFGVFYRYVHDTFPDYIGAGTFIASPIPGVSPTLQNNPGTQHVGKGTYTLSPTMVLNVGYSYSNGSIYTKPLGALLQSASPDVKVTLPYTNTTGMIPNLNFSTFTALGGGVAYFDHGINHQAFGDLTKTKGPHTFLVGFSYTHYQKQENSTASGNQGQFSFGGSGGYTGTNGNVTVAPPTDTTQTYVNGVQSFANFLVGNANGTTGFSQTNRNPQVDVNKSIWEGYFQDNWKLTSRLTLNLGVRYAYSTAPVDYAQFGNNFDPSKYSASLAPTIDTTGLNCFTGTCNQTGSNAGQSGSPNPSADYAGVNYINGMIFAYPKAENNNQASQFGKYVNSVQKNNFAPRLGFALDLFGDGKTALRGGYGWAYDDIEVSYWETSGLSNPPSVSTYSVTNASVDSPSGGAVSTTRSTTPGRIYAVPLEFKTPYVQQYSLGLQQQLAPSMLLEIGFVGSHGTHLAGAEEINQIQPGSWRGKISPTNVASNCTITGVAGGTPAFINSTCSRALNQVKPYLGYFAIDAMRTIFSSNYSALQVKTTKKFSGKTYIDGNFTWSRNLTNSPADYSGFIQDIYNPNGDYGRASLDRKLILTIDGVFEVPWFREQKGLKGRLLGGWMLSGVYAANSGLPLTIAASPASTGITSIVNYGNFPVVTSPNNPNNIVNDNAGLSVLGTTNAGLRVNQIGDPNSSTGGKQLRSSKKYGQTTNPWFNTAAFNAQDPLSNTPGTAKRGSINGPGFQRMDVGIFRNFRIWDNLVFQLRGEAFNVANHTNIQTVGTTATASTYGEILTYRDPRIMQIAGKITF